MEEHKCNKANSKGYLELTSAGEEASSELKEALCNSSRNQEASMKKKKITVPYVVVKTPPPHNNIDESKIALLRLLGAAKRMAKLVVEGMIF